MKLGVPIEKLKVIMIAHSLGCAIARLYADAYPGTVSALLLLDSTLANSDTISVFPDPKTPGFDERELPKGITAAMCSDTRRKFQVGYAADSPNKEGIWRGTLPALLPLADEPKLMGPGGRRPYVTVIRNDPVVYVMAMEKVRILRIRNLRVFEEMLTLGQILKVPSIMSEKYFDPYWQSYSEGLTKLTDSARSRGPIVAKGLGHMLIKEKGGPEFVAEQICELLDTMSQDEASKI
jgi:pimeloyl-ACP methyl ester carboxylesterase